MSGLKLVIDTDFTDSTLPVLTNDPVLTNGSLALLDATHSLESWPAGTPTWGTITAYPNIAEEEASKLVTGNLDWEAKVGVSWDNASDGILERTTKGGLHVANSPTTPSSNELHVLLNAAPAIRQYFLDNKDHAYYHSIWRRITRVIPPGVYPFIGGIFAYGSGVSIANHNIWSLQTGFTPGIEDPRRLGSTPPRQIPRERLRHPAGFPCVGKRYRRQFL